MENSDEKIKSGVLDNEFYDDIMLKTLAKRQIKRTFMYDAIKYKVQAMLAPKLLKENQQIIDIQTCYENQIKYLHDICDEETTLRLSLNEKQKDKLLKIDQMELSYDKIVHEFLDDIFLNGLIDSNFILWFYMIRILELKYEYLNNEEYKLDYDGYEHCYSRTNLARNKRDFYRHIDNEIETELKSLIAFKDLCIFSSLMAIQLLNYLYYSEETKLEKFEKAYKIVLSKIENPKLSWRGNYFNSFVNLIE